MTSKPQKVPTVYYVAGGETKVYHSTPKCAALKTPWRYWHLHEAKGKAAEMRMERLRPCRRCHT